MIIRTCNAIKRNAKYKKYLHQGYKIQQEHKCVVLKIIQQNLKVLKKMLQSKDIKTKY